MSKIEWTDQTWNPTVGCSRVSPGCEHCYAERVAHRGMSPKHRGLTVMGKHGPRWNGKVNLVPEALRKPTSWRRPRRVFVDSMSDLFHPEVPFTYIAAVFGVMLAADHHIYQVLTKRPERALEFFDWLRELGKRWNRDDKPAWVEGNGGRIDPDGRVAQCAMFASYEAGAISWDLAAATIAHGSWPARNVWIGVSAENRETLIERSWDLRRIPAAVRFISCEPLLEDLGEIRDYIVSQWTGIDQYEDGVDWLITGGESGPRSRPCDVEWIRSLVRQCQDVGVPVFVKQLGAKPCDDATWLDLHDRKGGSPSEWPKGLRVRQWPEVAP